MTRGKVYAVVVGQALRDVIVSAVGDCGGVVLDLDRTDPTSVTVYVAGPWRNPRRLQDLLFARVPGPSIEVRRGA